MTATTSRDPLAATATTITARYLAALTRLHHEQITSDLYTHADHAADTNLITALDDGGVDQVAAVRNHLERLVDRCRETLGISPDLIAALADEIENGEDW
ncbi:hypothetical protein [Micromonospora inyonensis]|uniref:Uncharacterized protein n=1 Tax=Micromonospora inyonensis TaxID=47866 RepID=A0A1C6RWM3_9ACTN|nr:hypothetical protein [Micromonospora inyonensis]SCL12819.1 hypothetical protein GA0074694_0013 [Micromonospora inyonensis]SCL21607.1 hypothetical protein GA0074694_3086 [Micromonospora inyonensis]